MVRQRSTFPVSVQELLAKTNGMNDTKKEQAAEEYLRKGRRFEAGTEKSEFDNIDMARRYFEASAKLGNTDAITTMGVYHSKGLGGLPIDEDKALTAYKTVAAANKQGSARAKRNLATYYSRGCGGLYQDGDTAYLLLAQVLPSLSLSPPLPLPAPASVAMEK